LSHLNCAISYMVREFEIRPCVFRIEHKLILKIYEKLPLPPPLLPPPPLPPPLPQQELLLGWVCSASSSTITTLRRVLLVLVSVDFCSASSARCIIRCVKSRNISSMFWFNLADVWKCIAPTCLAYLMEEDSFTVHVISCERRFVKLTLPLPLWQHSCPSLGPLYYLLSLNKFHYLASS